MCHHSTEKVSQMLPVIQNFKMINAKDATIFNIIDCSNNFHLLIAEEGFSAPINGNTRNSFTLEKRVTPGWISFLMFCCLH